jgi:hypothetical protein
MTRAEIAEVISNLEEFISKLDTWVLIFAALVAVGVVGEAVLGLWHWKLDGRMRDLRRTESQIHEKDLAQLARDTAEANARADEAKLELARLTTPRKFTLGQEHQLSDSLKRFAKTPFDFSVQTEPEPVALMAQLGEVLKTADWEWQPVGGPIVFQKPGMPNVGIVSLVGIEIQISESKRSDWEAAVIALRDGLNAAGIAANAMAINEGAPEGAIHIQIGQKP